jgi:hypothetical protein
MPRLALPTVLTIAALVAVAPVKAQDMTPTEHAAQAESNRSFDPGATDRAPPPPASQNNGQQ